MALLRARKMLERDGSIRAIGIAGPGDPLANEETMTTLRLVGREFPDYIKCLCTNGLALPEKAAELKEAGLNNLTVTVNAVDPRVGAKIYAHVIREKRIYRGEEAAALLWSRQKEGIERAVDCGLRVKVNTILIPGINDEGLAHLALAVSRLGVSLMNLVPLIPRGDFCHIHPPSGKMLRALRVRLQEFLPQMGWCRQCRADAAGLLHDVARCRTGCRPALSP
jgi:nitrogen fixation protein NifB